MQRHKAVSYLRVSGLSQVDGDGFDRQRAAIEKRAKAMRLDLVGEYVDGGVSGTLPVFERDGFADLALRIASNGIRIVLVEKADRLSRDLVESELGLRQLRDLGVQVIEAENGTDLTAADNPTAILVRQMLAAVAEFEKSALVGKLRAARVRKRRSGERVEGRKPYPAETVELLKKLRRRQKHGKPWSYQRIADHLNAEGVATMSGKPWTKASVCATISRKRA